MAVKCGLADKLSCPGAGTPEGASGRESGIGDTIGVLGCTVERTV